MAGRGRPKILGDDVQRVNLQLPKGLNHVMRLMATQAGIEVSELLAVLVADAAREAEHFRAWLLLDDFLTEAEKNIEVVLADSPEAKSAVKAALKVSKRGFDVKTNLMKKRDEDWKGHLFSASINKFVSWEESLPHINDLSAFKRDVERD